MDYSRAKIYLEDKLKHWFMIWKRLHIILVRRLPLVIVLFFLRYTNKSLGIEILAIKTIKF
jgi:hypothetical protein